MQVYQVDAFTEQMFSGNPAAVCILDSPQDESWLQKVAKEMNLSETAFLQPIQDGYNLRWFTPVKEVDLCGHATLAAAHVLWESKQLPSNQAACFHTKSGKLTATRQGEWIELDFPKEEATEIFDVPEALRDGLKVEPKFVGKNRMDYLVVVDSEDIVRQLCVDFNLLATLACRGVIVSAPGKSYDFVSRCFYPAYGIDEDPVTGSAHCCLAPYWQSRLGKETLLAYQASERGGVLKLKVEKERVKLMGQAVTVFTGNMRKH